MRKFSLAYLTIPGTNPMDQIRIAKECGYDSVSLRTISMHLPGEPEFLLDKDPALFAATRAALKEYDMPLMDIELARIRPDLDVSEYESAFEKAAELGATDVLGSIWTRDRAWYTETAARVADMAKQYGLRYNIEFLPWAGVRTCRKPSRSLMRLRATMYILWWIRCMLAAPALRLKSLREPTPSTLTLSIFAMARQALMAIRCLTTSRMI